MKKRIKANVKQKNGKSCVLANVGNSSSCNIRSSKPSGLRQQNNMKVKLESEDTDENVLQLGLGGLFLESLDPTLPKKSKGLEKAQQGSTVLDHRSCKLPVHHRQSRRGQKQASSSSMAGLFAFASQKTTSVTTKPRNLKIAKRKVAMAKPLVEENMRYPLRARVAIGYDAEKEDKPSASERRRQRRKAKKPQQAPGLFNLFAMDDNVGDQQHNDDVDWLCSRLDQHCSIAHGGKKRCAAPSYLLDSLCKRIDQKATPAKIETSSCHSVEDRSDDKSDAISVDAGDDEQEMSLATSVKDAHDSEQQDVGIELKQIVVEHSDTMDKDTKQSRKDSPLPQLVTQQPETDKRCDDTNMKRRPLLDPPGFSFKAASAVKAEDYDEARKRSSLQNPNDVTNAEALSMIGGGTMALSSTGASRSVAADICAKTSVGCVGAISIGGKGPVFAEPEPEKDHGYIYTNRDLETVHMSPITLASPLLKGDKGKLDVIDTIIRNFDAVQPESEVEASLTLEASSLALQQEFIPSTCQDREEMSCDQEDAGTSSIESGGSHIDSNKGFARTKNEGSLRRSRRHRKQTDRLSIDLGGERRMKQESIETNTRRRRADATKSKKKAMKRYKGAIPANNVQTTRRSKRAVVQTSFFHKMIEKGNEGRRMRNSSSPKSRQEASERFKDDSAGSSHVEDDFLDDSSTETNDAHTETTSTAGSQPRSPQKQRTISHEASFASTSHELPIDNPSKPSRRCQGLKIANRKLPALKKCFINEGDSDEWDELQLSQLHHAYNQIDPTSATFWQDISHFVDSKCAAECQAKWFSLAKTPCPKGKATIPIDHDDDDIFDNTPNRPSSFQLPSRLLHGRMQQGTTRRGIDLKPISHSQELYEEDSKPIPQLRQGFKTYLQDMRRDVNRAEKAKTKKKVPKQKPVRPIADQDHCVNMRAKLTPGGTLDFRHDEDLDEWDEDMYDADEEEMDDNA